MTSPNAYVNAYNMENWQGDPEISANTVTSTGNVELKPKRGREGQNYNSV